MAAARKPVEESVNQPSEAELAQAAILENTPGLVDPDQPALDAEEDPRAAALAALQLGDAEALVAEQEAIAAAAPVIDDKSFRKWDGNTKYLVTGGGFMAVVDGNHMAAMTGVVLGLSKETAQRGLDFDVLQKL